MKNKSLRVKSDNFKSLRSLNFFDPNIQFLIKNFNDYHTSNTKKKLLEKSALK